MRQADANALELARGQHGVITIKQARDMGLTTRQVEHRVATKAWVRLLPRTYLVAGAHLSWEGRLMAACLWSGGVASHRSAAVLHGLLAHEKPPVEVSTVRNCRSQEDLIVHRTSLLPESNVIRINGLPATDIERTILDLPQVIHPKRVSMVLDIARRKHGLTLEAQQSRCDLEARSGRNGLTVVRREIAKRDPRLSIAQSGLEQTVFEILDDPSIPPFERHVKFDTGRGYDFEVDIYWRELEKGAEIDDYGTHGDELPFNRDRDKLLFFAERGLHVIQISREMTRHPEELRSRIKNFLATEPQL